MFTRSTPRFKTKGSIAALEKHRINDVDQWLLLRGQDRDNPILLFLHGGPGTAQIGYARRYMRRLEEKFVVVNWDQRAAGISAKGIPSSTMNIEQFVADTYEVVQMLRKRFYKEKIYLVAHSWGTVIGSIISARHPDLFYAYTGVGQIGNMQENEKLAYEWLYRTATERQDRVVLATLDGIGPPPYKDTVKDMLIRGEWTSRYGGNMYRSRLEFFLLKSLFFSSEYTLLDRFRWAKGQKFSISEIWPELVNVDMFERVPEIDAPVYFLLGKHDYTIVQENSVKYFTHLRSPQKKLIWFENSAHCPFWEEPDHFADVMIDTVMKETLTAG